MREQKGISQEGLKLLACATMLIDHIGVVFFPQIQWLRIIGRLSFPLYCFLLAEGVHYTRSPMKYGLRLLLVALLAELPYDLLFYKKLTWTCNSVMVTLLLGFCSGISMKPLPLWAKPLAVIPFALASRFCNADYGMYGVLMIGAFLLARELPRRKLFQSLLIIPICLRMAGFPGPLRIQFYAVFALIPIFLYTGKKRSRNPALQWAFTLFYPVHLLILLLIQGF